MVLVEMIGIKRLPNLILLLLCYSCLQFKIAKGNLIKYKFYYIFMLCFTKKITKYGKLRINNDYYIHRTWFNFLKRRSLAPSHKGKSSPVQCQNSQTNGASNALKAFCSPLTEPITVKRTRKSPDENPKAKLRKPLSNIEDNTKVLVYVSNHVSYNQHCLKFRSEPKKSRRTLSKNCSNLFPVLCQIMKGHKPQKTWELDGHNQNGHCTTRICPML